MKVNLRIQHGRYIDETSYRNHMEYIKKYVDVIDEITIFVEYSMHGYWTKEFDSDMAVILEKVINDHKKIGIKSVGINVLNTIGHLEEAWDYLPKPPMQTMVGPDGRVSYSNLCPNTEEYREYIKERYTILSGSKPDFIWVDDDFRFLHHGPAGPCYCTTCIEKFNKACGLTESFESLTHTIKENPKGDIAKRWEKFWIDSLKEVAVIIEQAIHSVDDKIQIGRMIGFVGDGSKEWNSAFKTAKIRPGGGFYTDKEPEVMELKMLYCEYQLANASDYITDRQYEFESFPYQELGKATNIARIESLYGLMSGCNGIAYNLMNYYNDDRTPEMIRENKDLFNAVAERSWVSRNCGVYCSDLYEPSNLTAYSFMKIGIPITGDFNNASAYILMGDSIYNYTDDELLKILSGSVMYDDKAMKILINRGFGEYLGVKEGKCFTNGVMERFSDSDLNGEYKQYKLNPFMNFDQVDRTVFSLEILDDNVEVLSNLYTITGEKEGPCFTLYKNSLGGSVAVCTFLFSHAMAYYAKREQLLNLFDKMIPGGLPVRVNVKHKIIPVFRKNNDDYILMLANMSYDECGEFTVDIKGKKGFIIDKDGSLKSVKTEEINGKTRLYIDGIKPFDAVFAVSK